jgi:hypothetical protein
VNERKSLELNGWVMLVVALLGGGGWLIYLASQDDGVTSTFWVGILAAFNAGTLYQ